MTALLLVGGWTVYLLVLLAAMRWDAAPDPREGRR